MTKHQLAAGIEEILSRAPGRYPDCARDVVIHLHEELAWSPALIATLLRMDDSRVRRDLAAYYGQLKARGTAA